MIAYNIIKTVREFLKDNELSDIKIPSQVLSKYPLITARRLNSKTGIIMYTFSYEHHGMMGIVNDSEHSIIYINNCTMLFNENYIKIEQELNSEPDRSYEFNNPLSTDDYFNIQMLMPSLQYSIDELNEMASFHELRLKVLDE